MVNDVLESQLRRLITGLADQAIQAGQDFIYDGGVLYPDDVAEIGMPSILCLAQDLSMRLGTGDLGYRCELGPVNPVFPLHATHVNADVRFLAIAPFVTEVFDADVRACCSDMARLFESAAKVIRPQYDLQENTRYRRVEQATLTD